MPNLLRLIFRRAGLDKWAGFALVSKWLEYVLYRIFKPTNNEAVNSVLVGLYVGGLLELSDEIGRYLDEGRAWLWASTRRPIESATINWIGWVSGVEPKNLSKQGLLEWAGVIVAKQVNEQLGSQFRTFYPPAKAKDDIVDYVQGGVMNSGLGGAVDGFSILPAAEAVALMQQIAGAYNSQHNISLTAMEEKAREKLRKQVVYQKKYRQTHPQLSVNTHPRLLVVEVGVNHAIDDYYALYEAELARRAAEKAAKEAAAAAAAGGGA